MSSSWKLVSKKMAYSRSHQPDESEKKLQALRRQLYGKSSSSPNGSSIAYQISPDTHAKNTAEPNKAYEGEDLTYLNHDLKKTILIAVAILGSQLLLFWSLNNGSHSLWSVISILLSNKSFIHLNL